MKNKITHDPSEYIRAIQQIFISNNKKIGFLFGAGTSLANESEFQVPALAQMTNQIVDEISKENHIFEMAFQEIFKDFPKTKENIEYLLSNLQQKSELIGSGSLGGLDKNAIDALITKVKCLIQNKVSVHLKIKKNPTAKLVHSDFANWIKNSERSYPVEIFTTNYDYLFEIGLEQHSAPYFDGFSGSYEPFFCSEAVDDINYYPKLTKLWKLHGSLGWSHDANDNGRVLRSSSTVDDILIYPSHLKYSNSRKQPFVGLIDRLHDFLRQDDAVLITCGYSFGDEHINERILSALKRGANSHVIALLYDEVENKSENGVRSKVYLLDRKETALTDIAKNNRKISGYGMRSAIIGGHLGAWQLRSEPDEEDTLQVNSYFDEDAAEPEDQNGKGNERWTGKGRFWLSDFKKLTEFLNLMIVKSNSGIRT